ncbi:MAG: HAMP domain-containing sensor histidine kinase [Actinomycetota bacterium]
MGAGKAYIGVGVVTGVCVVAAVAGDRGAVLFQDEIGSLANGVFAAAAAFALFAYQRSRDPGLLLAGIGAAAVAGHTLAVALALALLDPIAGSGWHSVMGTSSTAGHLGLAGALVVVLPWKERRGRPPLVASKVARIAVAGLVIFDLLVLATRPSAGSGFGHAGNQIETFPWLGGAALLAAGAIAAIRSLPKGGRLAWIAAAGLATAVTGLSITLSPLVDRGADEILQSWVRTAPALAAGSLAVFVLVSLRLEASGMRRTTDRAAEVMEGRAEIASTIAHDVRGPVGTIKGLATTTRKSYDRLGDAERLEFIGMIEQESGRLLRLVDQVALALKVDAGSLDPHLRVQSLAPLLRQAVEQTEAGEHTIDVNADPIISAEADTRWFVEAVRQGLDNACGFSPPGTAVVLTLAGTEDAAIVTVAASGPGVPTELRESMFEKFSRWRPKGYEDRQGSGLGLFICRGIAQAHGGGATLEDAPSGGTMLRIWVPREGTPT